MIPRGPVALVAASQLVCLDPIARTLERLASDHASLELRSYATMLRELHESAELLEEPRVGAMRDQLTVVTMAAVTTIQSVQRQLAGLLQHIQKIEQAAQLDVDRAWNPPPIREGGSPP